MIKKTAKIRILAMLGAIICLIICILNVDSKLTIVIGGIAIGMHIMLIMDQIQKRNKGKKWNTTV